MKELDAQDMAIADLAEQRRTLKKQRDMLLYALREMTEDLEARWDMQDKNTNPGIRHCVEQARAAISFAGIAESERLADVVEEFIGWWDLNREGSVNKTYDYIDKVTKRMRAAMEEQR